MTVRIPPVVETTAVTPKVTNSKAWKIVAIIFLVILTLIIITRLLNKSPDKYDLAEVSYDQVLTFKVKPGRSVKLYLTNTDWCPIWSDGHISVSDNKKSKRVLDGDTFISGSVLSGKTAVKKAKYFIFKNKSKKAVEIKSTRCKSFTKNWRN